jgi:hypothetical protein
MCNIIVNYYYAYYVMQITALLTINHIEVPMYDNILFFISIRYKLQLTSYKRH